MNAPELPRPAPDAEKLEGRFAVVEKFDLRKHADELWDSIGSHDELWTHIPSGPFADKAEWIDYLKDRSTKPGTMFFPIRDRASSKCAGLYMLLKLAPEMGTAEIGLVYGSTLQRSAAGTEAFFLLANYVLTTLGYRRLEWRCSPEHEGSRRAAARYGFREEGTLRQTMWAKDHNWDTVMHSIIDGEWPALAGRFEAWLSPRNFSVEGQQIKALSDFA
jgi:RimJ/RimL family protein N-acetyltransferase